MTHFNFEQFREADPFVPGGAAEPAWKGRKANAALPPHYWSIPRDSIDGALPLATYHANNRLSAWTIIGMFLIAGAIGFWLASR